MLDRSSLLSKDKTNGRSSLADEGGNVEFLYHLFHINPAGLGSLLDRLSACSEAGTASHSVTAEHLGKLWMR